MQSTCILCVTVLMNIALIYCAHVIRDRFEDSVNIFESVNRPVSNGYFPAMKRKRAIKNWVPPAQFNQTMTFYDLTRFVENLNLQHCVIVEIGEGFCALFVETLTWDDSSFKPNTSTFNEQFLGICDCATIRRWHLCRTNLKEIRREDCTFEQATSTETNSARVHRRLCDISGMANWNTPCNCSQHIAQRLLASVIGFPTCYLPPLPESVCRPRSVCGVYACKPIKGSQVLSVLCDTRLCPGQQPFCEYPMEQTTEDRTINSVWTPWSKPVCNTTCGFGFMVSQSVCVDTSGYPALDCIGPGSSCCSASETQCECHVIHRNDNVLLVTKLLGPCTSFTPCSVHDVVPPGKRRVTRRRASYIPTQRACRHLSRLRCARPYTRRRRHRGPRSQRTRSLRDVTRNKLTPVDELEQVEDPLFYDSAERVRYREPYTGVGGRLALRRNDAREEPLEEPLEELLEEPLEEPLEGPLEELPEEPFEVDDVPNYNHFGRLTNEGYKGRTTGNDPDDFGSFDPAVYDQDRRPMSRRLLSFANNDYDYVIDDELTVSKKDLEDGDFLKELDDELEDATELDKGVDFSIDKDQECGNWTEEKDGDDYVDDGDDEDYDYDDDDGDDDDDCADDIDDERRLGGCGKTMSSDLYPTEAIPSQADDADDEEGEEVDLDDEADAHTAVKGPPALEPQGARGEQPSLIDKVVENSATRTWDVMATVVVIGWRVLSYV